MPPRQRTYRVFLAYDNACFCTLYPTAASKRRAVEAAVAAFLNHLQEAGYENIQPGKITVEATRYEAAPDGKAGRRST